MKIFYIIIFCICTISTYSQIKKNGIVELDTNGSYSFNKAIVTVYNDETKAEILTQTFNDTTSLQTLRDLPYPTQPVFLSVHIQSGILSSCILWNNLKDYNVSEEGMLLTPAKEQEIDKNPDDADIFSQPYRLSPLYTLVIEGNTATFTFREPYGNSQYDFPLEGKFVIILTKDESNKEIL